MCYQCVAMCDDVFLCANVRLLKVIVQMVNTYKHRNIEA